MNPFIYLAWISCSLIRVEFVFFSFFLPFTSSSLSTFPWLATWNIRTNQKIKKEEKNRKTTWKLISFLLCIENPCKKRAEKKTEEKKTECIRWENSVNSFNEFVYFLTVAAIEFNCTVWRPLKFTIREMILFRLLLATLYVFFFRCWYSCILLSVTLVTSAPVRWTMILYKIHWKSTDEKSAWDRRRKTRRFDIALFASFVSPRYH